MALASIPTPAGADAGASVLTTRQAFLRVFPGVMVAMFLAAADQTILASALPTIASSLSGFADISWIVISYLLAATIAAPLYGHLGDRFGRKRMLLGALAIFSVASLGCALAPTLLLLIIARAVQGLGGGGLMTLAQALIGEHVSPRERGRFSGYFATVFALASTSGPVFGAYLTEHVSWRAIFAINIPLGLVAAVLARRIPDHAPAREGRFRLDIIGALLFVLATLSLLFALSSGGHRYAWASWPIVALVIVAAAGFALLVLWERRAADPVLPLRLLAMPAIARSDAVVFCFGATLFATILFLPLYLQLGRGFAIGQSGLLLLPITLAMVVSSAITGKLVSRTGRVTIFPQLGMSIATLAFISLAVALSRGSTAVVLGMTSIAGIGLGMVMPPTQVTVQLAAGPASLGSATASIALSRAIGGATGVAIVGAVLISALGVAADSLPALLSRVIEAGPDAVAQMSVAERTTAAATFDRAYRLVFGLLAGVTLAGAALARTIPRPDWSLSGQPTKPLPGTGPR
ncbi:MAG: DHA2 family efflux MFS transporter permease subunit [Betaproteobacteria bacterium]